MNQATGKRPLEVNFKKKFEQAVFKCNPALDYLEFNHMTLEKIRHGNFKKLTDSEKLNFECCSSFVYKHKHTNEIQKVNLYYIPHDHHSISLTLLDLDALVKGYGVDWNDIELVYAVSVVKPLLKERLDHLVKTGEVKLDQFNVRVEFIDFKFSIVK